MFNLMTGEKKTSFQNQPLRPPSSAQQAKARLMTLLAHERALPLPPNDNLPFSIKGTSEGLVISFRNVPWDTIVDEVAFYLRHPQTRAFFIGARVLLNIDDRRIGERELAELIAVLEDNGIAVDKVMGDASVQQAYKRVRSAHPLSQPERLNIIPHGSHPIGALARSENRVAPALILHRSLHAGEIIRDPRSVVILGDVPLGSELVSDNDIVVFGKLNGVAHAGANGNMACVIAALHLSPFSMRIGTLVAEKIGALRDSHKIGQIVYAKEGAIVAEAWLSDLN